MISAENFAHIKDIYVSSDPQEHRPAWIYFGIVDGTIYIRASGTQSSWWRSAILSKTGQITIENKIYVVKFDQVSDPKIIEQMNQSYLARYPHYQTNPEILELEDSVKTTLKVTIEGALN